MAADSILPSVISALSGLGGVGLGAFLTYFRESKKEELKTRKASEYLAILVVAHLDELSRGFLQVSYDDGSIEGRPSGSDGCYYATESLPSFDPLSLDVDWIALPSDLMYDILNIPNQIETLKRHVSSIFDLDYDPPEFTSYYWARQRGAAVLGLEVCKVSARLRKFARLPTTREINGNLSPVQLLLKQKASVEQAQAAYQARLSSKPPSFV